MLLDVLQQDGRYAPVDPASVSTLQYNSPFTLPWRRRNEVALVVTPRDAGSAQQPVVRWVLARQSLRLLTLLRESSLLGKSAPSLLDTTGFLSISIPRCLHV